MNHSIKQRVIVADVKRDEDGFLHARVKELPHCHTQAKDFNTLITRLGEVIHLCLEIQKEEADEREKAIVKGHIATKSRTRNTAIAPFTIDVNIPSELTLNL